MPYTPPAWDSVNFEGSGDAYTSPAWDEVDFNQGHVYPRRLPATPAEHRQRRRFCCHADSADHDFWRSGGASISYSVGSGHPAGPRQPTSGTRSPTVPGNLRASGLLPRSSRACSPAGTAGLGRPPMGSIQRASAWAGPQGLRFAASVNPYLTSRGRLLAPATRG